MKQAQLKDQALRRAEELARSGKYTDYVLIEHALKMEGYKKARLWLDDRFIRQELNELCRQSRSGPTDGEAAESASI